MKVKLRSLTLAPINLGIGLENYNDIVLAMIQSVFGLNTTLDLTLIGTWDNTTEAMNFLYGRIYSDIYTHSNIVSMFDEVSGLLKLPTNSVKTDSTVGTANQRSMAENSPITSGEDFTITNPSSKGYNVANSSGTRTITDTNVNQQLDILDFRYRSTTLYLLIEKCILSNTDEYSTIW